MDANVLDLGLVGRDDVAVAGGKGANLGEMVKAGFPIPPGFVVSARACAEFFEHIDLIGLIEGLPDLGPEGNRGQVRRCQGGDQRGRYARPRWPRRSWPPMTN